MRKEVAQVWAQALRETAHKQGKNALEHRDKVCPLGVLTLLALTVGVCDFDTLSHFSYFDGVAHKLPDSVKAWAKMRGNSGEMEGEFLNLTALNDICGYTFHDLARVIEENWEKL